MPTCAIVTLNFSHRIQYLRGNYFVDILYFHSNRSRKPIYVCTLSFKFETIGYPQVTPTLILDLNFNFQVRKSHVDLWHHKRQKVNEWPESFPCVNKVHNWVDRAESEQVRFLFTFLSKVCYEGGIRWKYFGHKI